MKTVLFYITVTWVCLVVLMTMQHGIIIKAIRRQQVPPPTIKVVESRSLLQKEFGDEYKIIMAAAHRNGCVRENTLILFAIRKAENGPPGLEFGILCQAGTDLDTQAGWAAATIMKNRGRWTGQKGFIVFLGNRYCPVSVDPEGNVNWIRNVTYWYERFKGEKR